MRLTLLAVDAATPQREVRALRAFLRDHGIDDRCVVLHGVQAVQVDGAQPRVRMPEEKETKVMMERTQEEIEEQVHRAQKQIDKGGSAVPGMSYEEGVSAALRWATGETEDLPVEDDDETEVSDD